MKESQEWLSESFESVNSFDVVKINLTIKDGIISGCRSRS